VIIIMAEAMKPIMGKSPAIAAETQSARAGSAFLSQDETQMLLKHGLVHGGRAALKHVVHTPVTQDTPDSHVLEEREGTIHTGKHTFWPPDQGNGLTAWIFAIVFLLMIASVPFVLHFLRINAKFSWVIVFEGVALFIWLSCGLIFFTQLVEFQSPHFGSDFRTLTLVEAVYLFAQILTTVGYGDITPAHAGGQAIVACFVFATIILIAELISELSTIVLERAEKHVAAALEEASTRLGTVRERASRSSWQSVAISILFFAVMVVAGTCFYHLYPGEGKTWGQGLYMSVITLTTVGFGAFTAETEAGKVFGSFWMVVGVMALGYVVTSFTECMIEMREMDTQQKENTKYEDAAEDVLHNECADHQGRVDQMGYVRYALLKHHIMSKDEIDSMMDKFKALEKDRRGTVSVELVKKLSMSPLHQHRQSIVMHEQHL